MAGSARDKSSAATRHRAFNDSDEEDESNNRTSIRHEEIVSFGRYGAQRRKASPPPAAPLVIPVASNLDWRQDRKQRLGIASNLQSFGPLVSMRRADSSAVPGSSSDLTSNGEIKTDAINTEAQKSGLQLREPKARPSTTAESSSAQPMQEDTPHATDATKPEIKQEGTEDQAALKALLAGEGGERGFNGSAPLVITQEDEAEFLQHDIDSRPEAPTLDDYAATPIDQFGMALLRGMGWKEGMGAGKGGKGPQQAPEPKKRAALLGLGAKERPASPAGLPSSTKSRGLKTTDRRRDYKYVPVTQGGSQSASNGTSDRSREESRTEHRSRDQNSSRESHGREREDRHASSRNGSRHHDSRSSHRQRSRSPTRNRDDDRDRHRDRRRDDRDSERRSHGSSRSERGQRHDRERDDRRRDHRR